MRQFYLEPSRSNSSSSLNIVNFHNYKKYWKFAKRIKKGKQTLKTREVETKQIFKFVNCFKNVNKSPKHFMNFWRWKKFVKIKKCKQNGLLKLSITEELNFAIFFFKLTVEQHPPFWYSAVDFPHFHWLLRLSRELSSDESSKVSANSKQIRIGYTWTQNGLHGFPPNVQSIRSTSGILLRNWHTFCQFSSGQAKPSWQSWTRNSLFFSPSKKIASKSWATGPERDHELQLSTRPALRARFASVPLPHLQRAEFTTKVEWLSQAMFSETLRRLRRLH